MNINYNEIISTNSTEEINIEKLNTLSDKGRNLRDIIKRNHSSLVTTAKKAKELINGRTYQEYDENEKAIILANAVFPDNKKFINWLIAGNFNGELLKNYVILLSHLKQKYENGDALTKPNQNISKSVEYYTKKLYVYFEKIIPQISPEIIINKIIEISVLMPQLIIAKISECQGIDAVYANGRNLPNINYNIVTKDGSITDNTLLVTIIATIEHIKRCLNIQIDYSIMSHEEIKDIDKLRDSSIFGYESEETPEAKKH